MNNELIKVVGNLDIVLYDANYRVKQSLSVPNIVTTGGKGIIASRLIGTTPAVMSHMAIGTDNGTVLPLAAGNTALGTALGARVALATPTVSTNVVTYSATFTTAYSGAITEAGIFNALTGVTMLCRTVFSVINKETTDVLTINWNVTIN